MKRLKRIIPETLLARSRRWRALAGWFATTRRFRFSPRPQPRTKFAAGNVLVVAPHIDDETIGAGGTLLRLRDAGARITVVYVFSDRDRRRREEARRVAAAAGFDRLEFLGLPDVAKLPAGLAIPREPLAGSWDEIYLPHPHDNHPAHLALPELLAPWVGGLPANAKLFLYEVWTPLLPSVLVDISAVLARKQELLELYASQLEAKDYVAAVTGLARYRALLLPQRAGAAEAFLAVTPGEYLALAGPR